jgi:hypothetical protein
LPIEEAVFFLSTVILICFGMTLSLARASQARWVAWVNRIRGAGQTNEVDLKKIETRISGSDAN